MTLTIDLPDKLEAALKAQAKAEGVSEAGYIRSVLERYLASAIASSSKPFKTGFGSFTRYGEAPSAEEIDANRADMFQRFGDNF